MTDARDSAVILDQQTRIAELEAALKKIHGIATEVFLVSAPANEASSRAFAKMDKEMRRLGLLPALTK